MSGGRHRGGMGSTGRRGRQEGTGGVGQHSLCLRSACCVCVCVHVGVGVYVWYACAIHGRCVCACLWCICARNMLVHAHTCYPCTHMWHTHAFDVHIFCVSVWFVHMSEHLCRWVCVHTCTCIHRWKMLFITPVETESGWLG